MVEIVENETEKSELYLTVIHTHTYFGGEHTHAYTAC